MLSTLAIDNSVNATDAIFLADFYTFDDAAEWRLTLDGEVYQIASAVQKLTLTLDFREGNYRHRNLHTGKEPLLKAIKVKQKLPETVIDTTPGVLKDSFMLASRGINITAIERHPLLFVMVKQALKLVPDVSIAYYFGEAREHLSAFTAQVIYIDPMYPPKKKSAQVKKDMQVLHHLIGADSDAAELLKVARAQNSRVVVKRPSYAAPLGEEKPSFVSQTGATRFDIYLH